MDHLFLNTGISFVRVIVLKLKPFPLNW
jgi:hypothetical protein